MAGNSQPSGGNNQPKPPFQLPPKKTLKNTKVIIICFISLIVINVAGFLFLQYIEDQRWDYDKPTVMIANFTNETITINFEVNGKLEKVHTLEPDEDVSYFQKYHKGDTIRVYNPTNTTLDLTVVLERKNIIIYFEDGEIDIYEFY
jgi:hypothetical protein